MRPTTDRFASSIHRRTEIAAFDHDCPGGHSPGCTPVEVRVREEWVALNGEPIDDPEHLAFLEERRQQQQGGS